MSEKEYSGEVASAEMMNALAEKVGAVDTDFQTNTALHTELVVSLISIEPSRVSDLDEDMAAFGMQSADSLTALIAVVRMADKMNSGFAALVTERLTDMIKMIERRQQQIVDSYQEKLNGVERAAINRAAIDLVNGSTVLIMNGNIHEIVNKDSIPEGATEYSVGRAVAFAGLSNDEGLNKVLLEAFLINNERKQLAENN